MADLVNGAIERLTLDVALAVKDPDLPGKLRGGETDPVPLKPQTPLMVWGSMSMVSEP